MSNTPTPQPTWREDFRKARPELGWFPSKLGLGGEESEHRYFGYKYSANNQIHEVTDWGHIEQFISKVEQEAKIAEKLRTIEIIRDHGHQQDDDTIWCNMDEILFAITNPN